MRFYEVCFAHKIYGPNWSSVRVMVRGHALEAIQKALSLQNGTRKQLIVEEVKFLGEES